MLEINNLSVSVDDNNVISDFTWSFELGKNYALMWKNWSWKSSLLFSIMWHPNYSINSWSIKLDWEDLLDMSPDERSQKWIFLAFQNVPEIPWIKLFEFLKMIYNARLPESKQLSFMKFKKFIEPIINEMWISKDFLFRDLNVGFSWWEKRKLELLQMRILNPKYILLDEIDSWLDINSLRDLWNTIKSMSWPEVSFIIISHYFDIYEYLDIENSFIIKDWAISETWWIELIEKVRNKWF